MIEKEKLKEYANKLMFEMKDTEYETLEEEFDVILKQMDLIGKIKNIKDVEPMTYPFVNYQATLRKDEVKEELTLDEVLKNAKDIKDNQVRVPKVVEE